MSSILKRLLLSVLLSGAAVLLTIIFLLTTSAGANTLARLLNQFSGIQILEVSGSLNRHWHIGHLEVHTATVDLLLDQVDVQWQPAALWYGQLHIDQLRINQLELAMKTASVASSMPKNLPMPPGLRLIQIDELLLSYAQLATLNAQHQPVQAQLFSSVRAQARLDLQQLQAQISAMTPWGAAAIQGKMDSLAPFALTATLDWTGLALQQGDIHVPASHLQGDLSGDLRQMKVAAEFSALPVPDVAQGKKDPSFARGTMQATLTPFAVLPLESLHINVHGINPANFYPGAPAANLSVQGDFRLAAIDRLTALQGTVVASNHMPGVWNAGGLPFKQFKSQLTLTPQSVHWQSAQMDVGVAGRIAGDGEITFSSPGKVMPRLTANLNVHQLDLLQLDSRLKKTRLNGTLTACSDAAGVLGQLHLSQAQTSVQARLLLTEQMQIRLQQFTLTSHSARLDASGDVDLQGKQSFAFQTQLHDFNPAQWLTMPSGKIQLQMALSGQASQGWRLAAQLKQLSGEMAGQKLQGMAALEIREDKVVRVKQLQLDWGKNHLAANGSWQWGANRHIPESLQLALEIPDLAALTKPFQSIMPRPLSGSLSVSAVLSGNAAQPRGELHFKARKFVWPDVVALNFAQSTLSLEEGAAGQFAGELNLEGLVLGRQAEGLAIPRIRATLSGQRHSHQVQINADWSAQQKMSLLAQGSLNETQAGLRWQGQLRQCDLVGPLELKLSQPASLQLAINTVMLGAANWHGNSGQLQLQQFSWSAGNLTTRGKWLGLSLENVLSLWRSDLPLTGQLLVDADWQLELGQYRQGQFGIRRTGGDVIWREFAYGRPLPLGLQALSVEGHLGEVSPSGQSQPLTLTLQAVGAQLGSVKAQVQTGLSASVSGWALLPTAPLNGNMQLQLQDIQWLGRLLGQTLSGQIAATAQFSGEVARPELQAQIHGQNLTLSFNDLGVMLPNGILEATLDKQSLNLTQLTFSSAIKAPPRHAGLSDMSGLTNVGVLQAHGSVDWMRGQGSIAIHADHFPFMQSPAAWLLASGDAQFLQTPQSWSVTGKMQADGAYFSVPKQAAPKLSDDVVLKTAAGKVAKTQQIPSTLDFNFNTGNHFYFVGRGIDARLEGDIQLRSKNGANLQGSGSIQTVGGHYAGYGQDLAIERGIINFQGDLENPGLNVRAVRRGLPVEAGVEIIGTVARPEVRLISEPNVPDPDKLSWMVLGRSSEQTSGAESGMLLSAAGAIFGGDNGRNIPRDLANKLGLDEISLGSGNAAPDSQLPLQTVAGNIAYTANSDQVFSLGKHLTPDLVFSIERSLTEASNGVKLTWHLTRRFSIIGRTGSDTAIDGQYTFSFDSNSNQTVTPHD